MNAFGFFNREELGDVVPRLLLGFGSYVK